MKKEYKSKNKNKMKTFNFTTIAKIISYGAILSLGVLIILDAVKNGTTI